MTTLTTTSPRLAAINLGREDIAAAQLTGRSDADILTAIGATEASDFDRSIACLAYRTVIANAVGLDAEAAAERDAAYRRERAGDFDCCYQVAEV